MSKQQQQLGRRKSQQKSDSLCARVRILASIQPQIGASPTRRPDKEVRSLTFNQKACTGMSSEEKSDAARVSEDKVETEAETGANDSTSNAADADAENVADDEHEDPLVIDEAEEKSDGGDSDEKV